DVPEDLDRLCRGLLRRNPECRPTGPEILALLDGEPAPVVSQAPAPRAMPAPSEIFLGRNEQLQALRAAFDEATSGKSITLLVHGLSGMGKTALVRDFANELISGDRAVV